MRIGIFLPNWIGDVVMATPALRSLRQHFSNQAELIGIMKPYVSEVLAGTEWLDDSIMYRHRTARGKLALVRELRHASLDVILLLTNSLSTAALAWASGTKRRVGFAMHRRSWFLTDKLQAPSEHGKKTPRSAVDHYLDIIREFGVNTGPPQLELRTTADEEAAADQVWQKFGWSDSESVVTLNTGGAYGAAKSWPSSHFADVARSLADDRDTAVLVICGPAEREAAAEICRTANHPRVKSLAGESLSIGLSKACIRRSQLMITTDSGPRHFAAGFGVPVTTLFGPTDPRWSSNYHPQSVDIQLDVPCSPCSKRICPFEHHQCMQELTSRHVLTATQNLIDATIQRRAA